MADEFQAEKEMSRAETAAYLRKFADELEKGGRVVILSGSECRTVNPPNALHFRVYTSTDRSWLGGEDGRAVSIEMGWDAEEVTERNDLNIVPEPGDEPESVSERMQEIREEYPEDRDVEERREQEGTTRREH